MASSPSRSSDKPSYLGLLNAIAVGEAAAEPLFNVWAATTRDKRLAKALRFVGMREGEHGKAFAKRMLELGYEVRQSDEAQFGDQNLEIAGSDMSDLEKFEAIGIGRSPGESDVFDGMFADKFIDPVTGGLLGRYIAEERDSGRRLAAEYERLKAKQAKKTAAKKKAVSKKAVSKKTVSKKTTAKKKVAAR